MAWQLPLLLGVTRGLRGWLGARKKDEYKGFNLKNFAGSIVLALGVGIGASFGLPLLGVTDILVNLATQVGITWFGTDMIEDIIKEQL